MWIIKRDFFLLWNTYKSTLGLKKSMVAVEWTIFHFVMPHDPKNQSPRSPSTVPWIVLLNKDSKHIFIQHCSSPRKFTLFLLHFDRRNLYARANFVSILCIKLKEFISLKQKLWTETNKRVMLFFFDKAVFFAPFFYQNWWKILFDDCSFCVGFSAVQSWPLGQNLIRIPTLKGEKNYFIDMQNGYTLLYKRSFVPFVSKHCYFWPTDI